MAAAHSLTHDRPALRLPVQSFADSMAYRFDETALDRNAKKPGVVEFASWMTTPEGQATVGTFHLGQIAANDWDYGRVGSGWKRRAIVAWLAFAGGLCAAQPAEPPDPQAVADAKRAAEAAAVPKRDFRPAYPPSLVIARLVFDDSTARTEAPGSDIWPITWAADGHLYTPWGDGGGFGGTNAKGRVSLGFARVRGGPRDYRGENIAGGVDAPHPAPFTGKSEGVLALGDTLYLWRDGDASSLEYFKFCELWRSDDRGATWRACGVRFSKSGGDFAEGDAGIFAPAFCQFGKGYAGARDDFVYVYAPDSIDPTHWRVRIPGRINLLRVPRGKIESKPDYEFFAGMDERGQPSWTRRTAERKPVWEDAAQGTHRVAVSFNAGLKRYLLTTITIDRSGWMSVYDAPEPWGPWTHVQTEHNPDRWGTLTIIFTFVNKWLGADGRDFILVHTKNDRWATIEGRFELRR